jgi:serine/threonine protein phosphatase PrpC
VSAATKINAASVSDRGLNEKRPLNEDSFFSDVERGIFVVADGVGGAEAGEVASQTAVEVLSEAFRHQLADGDDAEDLMELAIQRANHSIHQLSIEHPKFSSMATTVVALHLESGRATFGHVGDSRLYRLSPDGKLTRETEDHSIVEEEVRAGRMTPEQAANHPSKNVISRALGAEASVEVDMKTTEVADGTTFLLCTDGITRHLSDNELGALLRSGKSPDAICAEMKERCYQRGAEDNLTAVIVQVGTPKYEALPADEEPTVTPETMKAPAAIVAGDAVQTRLTPPSRIAFPAPSDTAAEARANTSNKPARRGSSVLRFFVFLLFLAVAGGAFYGGIRYQQLRELGQSANPQPTPEDRAAALDRARTILDSDPKKWLSDNSPATAKPTDSKDPEFLYLYGRAQMLSGNNRDAMQAFELALQNLQAGSKASLPLEVEVKLAEAAAALKLQQQSGAANSQQSKMADQKVAAILDEVLALRSTPAPSPSK